MNIHFSRFHPSVRKISTPGMIGGQNVSPTPVKPSSEDIVSSPQDDHFQYNNS